MKNKTALMILLIIALIILIAIPAQAANFIDISGNWAENAVNALVQKQVIAGYPDGSFRPYRLITRAEFAKLISTAFQINPSDKKVFRDTSNHWARGYIGGLAEKNILNGYSNGYFGPEQLLSRAEVVTILMRVREIVTQDDKFTEEWGKSFEDLPQDNWAFRATEAAKRLNVLPSQWTTNFEPQKPVTRSEAAWLLNQTINLNITKGKISGVNLPGGSVVVQTDKETKTIPVSYDAIILRNHVTSSLDQFQTNDEIMLVIDANGEAKMVKTLGLITKNDMFSRISILLKNKVSPDQVAAALNGDWSGIQSSLKGELYESLINMGLSPSEAESLLVSDWDSLSSFSRERLSQALSAKFGLSLDLSQALLNRDTTAIMDAAKVDLTTALIAKLLPNIGSF